MPERNLYPAVFGRTTNAMLLAGLIFALTAGADVPGPASAKMEQASGSEQARDEPDPAAMRRGRILFLQCRACHSLKQGEEHKVGPNLHRVIGAPAAHKPGYVYTDSLKQSRVVWSRDNLSRFLADPYDLVPGTAMVFIGIQRGADRAALIDYLEQETQ
ncbi:MAG: c-type cytochrome [Gammaproteobacteria bacterium]|nr:c-type cytochrome [Gammaproteobacteria bacterium]